MSKQNEYCAEIESTLLNTERDKVRKLRELCEKLIGNNEYLLDVESLVSLPTREMGSMAYNISKDSLYQKILESIQSVRK